MYDEINVFKQAYKKSYEIDKTTNLAVETSNYFSIKVRVSYDLMLWEIEGVYIQQKLLTWGDESLLDHIPALLALKLWKGRDGVIVDDSR